MNDSTHITPSPQKSKLPKTAIEKGLYLVATPIGNLEDITLRALRILANVDVIACEDTRTSHVLLAHYGIKTPCVSYHEHNGEMMRPKLLARLNAGDSVALISDAGTPLISDPGYKLVRDCAAAGIIVIPIPGASAVLTALCASGLPTDQFLYIGFLPNKSKARRDALMPYIHLTATLVCFESPNRVADSLADIAATLGGAREVVLARELTKRFEEFRRGTASELAAHYAQAGNPKGEVVILIAPATQQAASAVDIDALLISALSSMSVKEAAEMVSLATGASKRDLYQRALQLKS